MNHLNNNDWDKTRSKPLRAWLAILLVGAAFLSGCRSSGESGSGTFAAVVIQNRTAAEIEAATGRVFGENGYNGGVTHPGKMVFNKNGSRSDTLARDGLVAASEGAVTLVRIRLEVVQLGSGSYRLQGQTYMVSGAGDSFFEEEHRLANFRKGPYQSLLDEVAKRLK